LVGDTFDQPSANGIVSQLNAINQAAGPPQPTGTFDPNSGAPKAVHLRTYPGTTAPVPLANAAASTGLSTGAKVGLVAAGVLGAGLIVWAVRRK
jgi:hypothetical protein